MQRRLCGENARDTQVSGLWVSCSMEDLREPRLGQAGQDHTVLWFRCAWAEGGVAGSVCTHVVSEQMFLWPQNGRRTVAKALPWLNISVTCEGR